MHTRTYTHKHNHTHTHTHTHTQVERYLALLAQYASLCAELRVAMDAPRHCLPFLQPGRLVRVMPEAYDAQVCVCMCGCGCECVDVGGIVGVDVRVLLCIGVVRAFGWVLYCS
jgi:hypothetical protein